MSTPRYLSMGPDPEPTIARTLEVARPKWRRPERTQFAAGHVLGSRLAVLYGRHGAGADELESIAADLLGMAAVLRQEGP